MRRERRSSGDPRAGAKARKSVRVRILAAVVVLLIAAGGALTYATASSSPSFAAVAMRCAPTT